MPPECLKRKLRMIKLKIFQYSADIAWNSVGDALLKSRYNENEAKGIVVSDISKKEIRATYYEKISYIEIIHDPIAGDITENRTTYLATKFHLYRDGILCIINPSKKISNFITYISMSAGFIFKINEKKLNIEKFCRLVSSKINDFVVVKATFNKFELSDFLQCSMVLSSRVNIFEQLSLLNFNIPNIANKITFEGRYNGQPIRCEISDTGSIGLSNQNLDSFLDLIISEQKYFY